MKIDILTLFPDSVMATLGTSILGRAEKKGAVDIRAVQIRDFTENKQQQVDDYPYGGGFGCVMMAQPLKSCLDSVTAEAPGLKRRVIYMSPQGEPFNQNVARRLLEYEHLVLVCGHYEGVDERFIESCCDEEISLGDFVLTGGEIAAMAVADCVCRMVPGVLSDPQCYIGESHWDGLLEYPQYTRPETWEGRSVPPVLLGGNHADICAWRLEQQLLRTQAKRPDLFEAFEPRTKEEDKIYRHLAGTEALNYDCRRAEAADLETLRALAEESAALLQEEGTEPADSLEDSDFAADISQGGCWLFTHEEKPAGAISVRREPEGRGVLRRLLLGMPYRNRGLAEEMLQLGEDLLLGSGCGSVQMVIRETNRTAQDLLEKRGYQLRGFEGLAENPEPGRACLSYEKMFV